MIEEKELLSFLEGKNICIVGPSNHLENLQMGPIFDTYDVCIRVNRDYKGTNTPIHYGSKIDILYTSLCSDLKIHELVHLDYLKYIVCPLPNIDPYNKDIINWKDRLHRLVIVGNEHYDSFVKQYGSRPFTGTMCVSHIVNNVKFKSLMIAGFSFYSTNYRREYLDVDLNDKLREIKQFNNHVINSDIAYFTSLMDTDNISFDDYMVDFLTKGK